MIVDADVVRSGRKKLKDVDIVRHRLSRVVLISAVIVVNVKVDRVVKAEESGCVGGEAHGAVVVNRAPQSKLARRALIPVARARRARGRIVEEGVSVGAPACRPIWLAKVPRLRTPQGTHAT